MQYPQLPDELQQHIDQKRKSSVDAARAGDNAKSEVLLLEAWHLIPEPKNKWDYYAQSITREFVMLARDTHQFEKAKHWLELMREAFSPPSIASEEHINFLEGTVLFEAGELDAAFTAFDKLYKKYKKRPFQGEDGKYLEFYLNRKIANGAP